LPERTDNPVVNGILQDLTPSWQGWSAVGAAGGERSGDQLVYVSHQGAGRDSQQRYQSVRCPVAQASEQRAAQEHQELRSISMFISALPLLALVITGFAGWYIYRNLGSNLTAISRAMSRLARGEPDVPVPALQRRDELGELARAFNVFARNTASLEHTSKLLKEKHPDWRPPFHAMRDGFALFDSQAAGGVESAVSAAAWPLCRCLQRGSTIRACCVR
jgi:HAMP domain-containing protein